MLYEKIFHILTRQYTNVNYLSDTENSLSNTLNAVHVCDLSHTNLSFKTTRRTFSLQRNLHRH